MGLVYIVIEEIIQYDQKDSTIIGVYNKLKNAEDCAIKTRAKYGDNKLSFSCKEIYVYIRHTQMNTENPCILVQDIEPKYHLTINR